MPLRKNTFFCIRSESRLSLNLRGNELLIYSIIESIALKNELHLFSGSLKYLIEWSGLSKPTIIKILNSLVNKKILFRYDDKDSKNRNKPYYRLNENIVFIGKEILPV